MLVLADDLLFDESALKEPTARNNVQVHVTICVLGLYVVGVDYVDVLATTDTCLIGVRFYVHFL
jgi:hypothetical protein